MKKMITALVAVLALSACTVNVDSEPTTTPTPSASASAEPFADSPVAQDQRFIEDLRGRLPGFENSDPQTLIDAGRGVCTYFDDYGVSLKTLGILSQQMQQVDFTREETSEILLAATDAYCPETMDEILSLDTTPGASA